MKAVAGTVAIILALIVAIIIGVGMWQFSWFLEAKNAEKQAEVIDNSPNAQRGYRQAARDAIEIVLDPKADAALVKYNTGIACENIASIDPSYMTEDLESFKFANC